MMKKMIINAGMSIGANISANIGANISANISESLGKLSSLSFGSSNGIVIKGQVAIVALILSLGITSASSSIKSLATEIPEMTGSGSATPSLVTPTPITSLPSSPPLATDLATGNSTLPTSGTYLYGQTPVAGQLGQEYMVFEVRQGRVVGALYMPSSEFSCFQGTLSNNQMNVTVANSYDNSAFIHQIAQGQQDQRLAAVGGGSNLLNEINSLTYPHELELDNYHRISDVSANDQRLLATCQARYQ